MIKETPDNSHSEEVTHAGGRVGSLEGARKTLLKQMIPDARDCMLEWRVDFAQMTITVHANIISPQLLRIFLASLPSKDERFQRAETTTVTHICRQFKVKLCVYHDAMEAAYLVSAYQDDGWGGPFSAEIELVPEG